MPQIAIFYQDKSRVRVEIVDVTLESDDNIITEAYGRHGDRVIGVARMIGNKLCRAFQIIINRA